MRAFSIKKIQSDFSMSLFAIFGGGGGHIKLNAKLVRFKLIIVLPCTLAFVLLY